MADQWTRDSAGVFTLETTTPVWTAVVAGDAMPALAAIKATIDDPADEVALLIYASPNAKWAWEVYTDGGTGGNVRIRKRTAGTAAAHVATAAHGLTTGTQFSIEVRVIRNKLEVYLNGSTTAVLTYTIDAADSLLGYDGYGFASDTDGAIVQGLQKCSLVAQFSEVSEVLVAVCGGELWACIDGETLFRVDPRAMDAAATISMVEFEQKMYMVGGGSFRIFDPATLTVSNVVPNDAGTLPGATAGVAGSCTATLIENHVGRIWLGGVPGEPQNLYASKLNDPLGWLTGQNIPGEAIALSAANTAKLGQPVVGLLSTGKTRMIVGCTNSMWEIVGDPTLEGSLDVSPLVRDFGLIGKDAITMAGEGLVVGLSHHGVFAVPEGGAAQLISPPTIRLAIAREGLMPQVIRDVARHGVHLFLTAEAAGVSTHYWLDERLNGLSAAVGGYFPEQYPNRAGPTCSCVFRGEVLIGGRDGYIRVFDDAEKDDDGESIVSYAALGVVVQADLTHDTILESAELILGELTDGVTVTVFEAATPEQAYGVRGDRFIRWSRRFASRRVIPLTRKARGGAIVMDVSNALPGETWVMEACQITTTPVQRIHRIYTSTTTAPVPDGSTSTTTTTESTTAFPTGPETTTTTGTTTTALTTSTTTTTTVTTGTGTTTTSTAPTGTTAGTTAGETLTTTAPGATDTEPSTTAGSTTIPPFSDTTSGITSAVTNTTTATTDPGCTDCEAWMAANANDTLFIPETGQVINTYQMAFWFVPEIIAFLQAARDIINEANLCNVPANFLVYVEWTGGPQPTPPAFWLIDDLLAIPNESPYTDYKLRVHFACSFTSEA